MAISSWRMLSSCSWAMVVCVCVYVCILYAYMIDRVCTNHTNTTVYSTSMGLYKPQTTIIHVALGIPRSIQNLIRKEHDFFMHSHWSTQMSIWWRAMVHVHKWHSYRSSLRCKWAPSQEWHRQGWWSLRHEAAQIVETPPQPVLGSVTSYHTELNMDEKVK